MAMFKAGNAFSKKQPAPAVAPSPAPAPAAPRPFGGSKLPSMSRGMAPAPVAAPTRAAPANNPMSARSLFIGMPRTGRTAPVATPAAQAQPTQRTSIAPAPRTLAPTGASMGVPGMDFRMSKGGMTKKTGYAKGGAVMCGASMPPAQKRKK